MSLMDFNANFQARAVVHSATQPWQVSPMPGVKRRPLDRVGDEIARATSVVSYAPGSAFSPHVHTGGEEFYVISGVFQDEHGDFPAGSYIRNPPHSKHTPRSDEGCTIFVKLWQFDPNDNTHVRLQTNDMTWKPEAYQQSVSEISLYNDDFESVSLQLWEAGQSVVLDASLGLEIFVLDGGFEESNERFTQYSWLRLPIGSTLRANTGGTGAKVWVKQNHLTFVDAQIKRVSNSF